MKDMISVKDLGAPQLTINPEINEGLWDYYCKARTVKITY